MEDRYDPFDFEAVDRTDAGGRTETTEATPLWDNPPASGPIPATDRRTDIVGDESSAPHASGATEPEPKGDVVLVEVDEDLEDLIPDFMENRRKEIERMTYALDAGDFSTIQAGGHVMKGSGGGYGFDYVTEIGAELETLAKTSDTQGIRTRLEVLSDYLDRVQIVYV